MEPYKIELTASNVLTVRFNHVSVGWEQWVLLRSDAHNDNIHCDREFEQEHLRQAKERNALIFDGGDLFCAMQGKYDPRANMSDIRAEDVGVDYLDRIVDHAAEQYAEYAKQWVLLATGNHETSILNRHHHSLTSELGKALRKAGGKTQVGGYGGWVRTQFIVNKTKRSTIAIKYYHGSGGSDAQVTRGTIQTNRQAVYLPDADVVWNGHNHYSYVFPIARERLSDKGVTYQDVAWQVRTPGYKDEYGDGSSGWAVEKGKDPKPLGACWLRFYVYDGRTGRIGMDAIQAIRNQK